MISLRSTTENSVMVQVIKWWCFGILQPTAEQIRYAQLLNTEDAKVMKEKIKQVTFNLIEIWLILHNSIYLLYKCQKYTFWWLSTLEMKKLKIEILTAFCSGEHVLFWFFKQRLQSKSPTCMLQVKIKFLCPLTLLIHWLWIVRVRKQKKSRIQLG